MGPFCWDSASQDVPQTKTPGTSNFDPLNKLTTNQTRHKQENRICSKILFCKIVPAKKIRIWLHVSRTFNPPRGDPWRLQKVLWTCWWIGGCLVPHDSYDSNHFQKRISTASHLRAEVFWGGLFGMISVPIFTALTHCPAWSGMMLVLGLLGMSLANGGFGKPWITGVSAWLYKYLS